MRLPLTFKNVVCVEMEEYQCATIEHQTVRNRKEMSQTITHRETDDQSENCTPSNDICSGSERER